MATNLYLERMNQLEESFNRDKINSLEKSSGLPLNRPFNANDHNLAPRVPTQESPLPQEDEGYKESQFYQNFENFQNEDPRFNGIMDELGTLATGLKQQVDSGYMPPSVARQKIEQFVRDTSSSYSRNADKFKKEDDKAKLDSEMMEVLQGLGGGSIETPQGQPQQQSPQSNTQLVPQMQEALPGGKVGYPILPEGR